MKKYKLGELINVTRGMSLPGDKYAESGDLIRLTLGNFNLQGNGFKLNTSKTDLYYTGAVKKEFIMNKGDIITPLTEQTYGLLGATARIPESGKYIQSQDVALIKSKSEKLYEDFCYYLISSPSVRKQLGAAAQQTKIRHTSPDKIKDCEVIIPEDITQQIKITKLLNSIEDKIALNNKTNAELESMAKTVYDYWFTQFDFPDKNGNPYKTSGGQMIYNETLKREIPVGWEVGKVGNYIEKRSKKVEIPTSDFLEEGIYPIVDQSTSFIAGYTNEKGAVIDLPDGAIIFGDHTRILKYLNFPFVRGGDGTQLITSNTERIPSILFYFMLKNIDLSNNGYARHYKFLKDKNIIIPDLKTAKNFKNIVSELYFQIKNNIQENEELTKLRDYLLPLLMNGQLEVK